MSHKERFAALSASIMLHGLSRTARRLGEAFAVRPPIEELFEGLAVRALDHGVLTDEEREFLEGTVERCQARSFGRTLAAIDALPEV